jgi:hypothetical protein
VYTELKEWCIRMAEHLKRDNLLFEGSRFILPEHKNMLMDYAKQQKKINKPTLDEQKIEEINDVIRIALEEYTLIQVKVYKHGFIEDMKGYIEKVDTNRKVIVTRRENDEVTYVRFKDILDCKLL